MTFCEICGMSKLIRPVMLPVAAVFASSLSAEDGKPRFMKLLGDLKPGTTVDVPDGTFVMKGYPTISGVRGTEQEPVVIRAAHRGRTIIAGTAGLILKDCEHVVVEGFRFENDADRR